MGRLPDNLCLLVAAALHGRSPDPEPFRTTTAEEWSELFRLASVQGVTALALDGIEQLPVELLPPKPMLLRWVANADAVEKRYSRQAEVLGALASYYARNGIRTLVLKGLGLSIYYPNPSHRECGDIDIWLYGAFEQGNRLLREKGVEIEREVPKHAEFTLGKVHIENHRTFLNVRRNRREREINDRLEKIIGQHPDECIPFGKGEVRIPPADFNALYLVFHAALHFAKEGIALRHLCDWVCFLEKSAGQIDRQLLDETLRRYRLDTFADLMTALCSELLDLPVAPLPCDATLKEKMKEAIFNDVVGQALTGNPLNRLLKKTTASFNNRWRYEEVLHEPLYKVWSEVIRAQFREKNTLLK